MYNIESGCAKEGAIYREKRLFFAIRVEQRQHHTYKNKNSIAIIMNKKTKKRKKLVNNNNGAETYPVYRAFVWLCVCEILYE
jgi:hypothetical protein